jgi:hypothetical protein
MKALMFLEGRIVDDIVITGIVTDAGVKILGQAEVFWPCEVIVCDEAEARWRMSQECNLLVWTFRATCWFAFSRTWDTLAN